MTDDEVSAYDDWGRTLSKFQGDASTVHAEYHYRYGDKLKWYTTTFAGESRVDYNYDGLGKRRNKMVNQSGLIWYRWEGWNELGAYAEGTDPNTTWDIGALERYYVPGLADYQGSNPATGGAWNYHLTDHLGSPRTVLGQSKEILARYAYTPYGETAIAAGLPLHIGYTGHMWEPEIEKYAAPFRNYSPSNARWTTNDPAGYVDGPNKYAYAKNSPALRSDALGLETNRERAERKNKCQQARQKIKNLTADITKRVKQYAEDHLKLPEETCDDNVKPSKSRRGHRRLIKNLMNQREHWKSELLRLNCKDFPPPPGGPVPEVVPGPVPVPLPEPTEPKNPQTSSNGGSGGTGHGLVPRPIPPVLVLPGPPHSSLRNCPVWALP